MAAGSASHSASGLVELWGWGGEGVGRSQHAPCPRPCIEDLEMKGLTSGKAEAGGSPQGGQHCVLDGCDLSF